MKGEVSSSILLNGSNFWSKKYFHRVTKYPMQIDDYFDQFCEYQSTIKNYQIDTIKSYRASWRMFRLLCPVPVVIEDVTPSIAEQFFYIGRTTRHWKPITFVTYHKGLNVFYKWALKNRLVETNPFEHIEKPRLEKKLPTKLTKNEAKNLLETVKHMWPENAFLTARNYAIFSMFIYCGLRKGELLRLKVVDVDIVNLIISIHQGKGNKDRVVPMPMQLRPILQDYMRERARMNKTSEYFYVSLQYDQNFGMDGFKHLVDNVKKASGIKFYPHMLRHTFATLMLEGGCDIYALSKMMGHNDIKTTTIYLSASVEHLRSQIGKHPLSS